MNAIVLIEKRNRSGMKTSMQTTTKYRGRSIALLLSLVLLFAALSGCAGFNLKDLAQDFVQVNVNHEVVSQSENNVPLYTCILTADITNNYAVPLVNAKTTISLPSGMELIDGKQDNTAIKVDVGDSLRYTWTVKIPVTTENQNVEYSVTVTSEVSSAVTSYDSMFVKGVSQEDNRLDFSADTWSFENFGQKPVPLTQEDYNAFMSVLSNSARESWKDYIKENSSGGLCYGMAATTVLRKVNQLSLQDVDPNQAADTLRDIKKSDDSKSVIGYYWLTQSLGPIADERNLFNSKPITEKLQIVSDKALAVSAGDVPFILSFNTQKDGGGHAVTAYGLENGQFKRENGVTYNSRILIYDNNHKNFDEKSCLYFNSGTSQWYIPNYPNSSDITRALDDVNLMNISNIAMTNKSVYSYIRARETMELMIYPADGSAPIKVNMTDTNNGQNATAYFDDGSDLATLNIAIKKPADQSEVGYQIEAQQKGAPLNLTINYDNYYLAANAKAPDAVVFNPIGSVGIEGTAKDFNLSLTGNDGYHALPWYTFNVSGNSAFAPKIEATSDGYVLSGTDFKGVKVIASNDADASELAIKTDQDKIMITSDGTNITASVDTNGDGKFETLLATGKPTTPDDPFKGGGNGNRLLTILLSILGGLIVVGGAVFAAVKLKIFSGFGKIDKKRKNDDDEYKW